MGEVILQVDDLSKQYRLGVVGTGTLSHDLNRWWAGVRGKEDPTALVGVSAPKKVSRTRHFWALREVSFSVERGEVLGIIGKNGAGKSTLLKILSRVTTPTSGRVRYNGRIASLLEVGTGFHPELTGQENIFLNGAILGMTKGEIRSKYSEIVEFSGVGKYIETPVKRYSSGMKVRLAFAVAAHLDPEILVVDEVLAVGDADFQKKAIGKMQDIATGEGRTVLFVSHDMDTINKLTSRSIVLVEGRIAFDGDTPTAVSEYLNDQSMGLSERCWDREDAPGNEFARLKRVAILDQDDRIQRQFEVTKPITVEVEYWDFNQAFQSTAILHVLDDQRHVLFATNEFSSKEWDGVHDRQSGLVTARCTIPGNLMAEGRFVITVAVGNYNPNMVHARADEVVGFQVVDSMSGSSVRGPASNKWPGLVRPMLDWTTRKVPLSE